MRGCSLRWNAPWWRAAVTGTGTRGSGLGVRDSEFGTTPHYLWVVLTQAFLALPKNLFIERGSFTHLAGCGVHDGEIVQCLETVFMALSTCTVSMPAFATLMRAAIKEGTEEDLVRALQQSEPVRFYRRLVGLSPAVVAGLV